MSGKIVKPGRRVHACSPGWEWKAIESDPELRFLFPDGQSLWGVPPSRYKFPARTVWECDCGRTWVSLGCDQFGGVYFKPESRFARWRRTRRERGRA